MTLPQPPEGTGHICSHYYENVFMLSTNQGSRALIGVRLSRADEECTVVEVVRSARELGEHLRRIGGQQGAEVHIAKLTIFCKFLAGSFSAVSKRIFARKYAFDRLSAFFKIYKMRTLLHRCDLKTSAKNRFE